MDKNEYTTEDVSKSGNSIWGKISGSFKAKETPFTAESAFIQSKYGCGAYKSLDERILDKQAHIKSIIKSKFAPGAYDNRTNYSSYHAVVDIEEDLTSWTEAIFKPFKEGGFEIIDLSKECKSITSDGIYLISWRNAFNKK